MVAADFGRDPVTYDSGGSKIPAAALDTNVFRDLYEPRPRHIESIALLDGWLDDEIEFVITGELETEINRRLHEIPSLAGTVHILRQISDPFEKWGPMVTALQRELAGSGVGEADLRQLAQSAIGGVRFFVTRDRPILNRADDIEALAGIRVVSPSSLLLELHAQLHEPEYQASAVLETELVLKRPTAVWVPAELRSLVASSSNESASKLVGVLTDVAARTIDGARLWSIEAANGTLMAVAGFSIVDRSGVVPVLRVRSGPAQLSFTRQLIHQIRTSAISVRAELRFVGEIPDYLARALFAEGFRLEADAWSARCSHGVMRSGDRLDDNSDLLASIIRSGWGVAGGSGFCVISC